MSGWIDIRFRKPTEADADKSGNVCWLFDDNSYGSCTWDCDWKKLSPVAWMPVPEFVPLPDPTYRPFANAAEFLPHSHRPLRSTKSGGNHHIRVDIFNDEYWALSGEYNNTHSYAVMLEQYVFGDDGTPCGVKVGE